MIYWIIAEYEARLSLPFAFSELFVHGSRSALAAGKKGVKK